MKSDHGTAKPAHGGTTSTATPGQTEVSIIVASHNKGPYVAETIRSALAQGPLAEVVVVDDASTDGSQSILRGLAVGNPRLRLIELPSNRGGSHCRNIGIREARGEFVIFLDADDLLGAGCCAGRLDRARSSPHHDLWIFPMRVFRDDPSVTETTWIPRPGNHLAHFLAHRLDWSIMQPLWRRDFLERIGGFDESFVRLQDPELHVRALMAGARVCCHPEGAADCYYRVATQRHADGCSAAAKRHVAGAMHFYRTFFDRVPQGYRHLLTGNLLASLAMLNHWRRSGQLDGGTASRLANEVIDCCQTPRQRMILRVHQLLNRAAPTHVPGLTWIARALLDLRN